MAWNTVCLGYDPWPFHRKQDGARQVRPLVCADHTLPSVAIHSARTKIQPRAPRSCWPPQRASSKATFKKPKQSTTHKLGPKCLPHQERQQELTTAITEYPYMKGRCRGQKCWTCSHHKWEDDHLAGTAASHPYHDKNWYRFLAWRRKENAGWWMFAV